MYITSMKSSATVAVTDPSCLPFLTADMTAVPDNKLPVTKSPLTVAILVADERSAPFSK